MKMPTAVGIFIFINRENFMLSMKTNHLGTRFETVKSFKYSRISMARISLGPWEFALDMFVLGFYGPVNPMGSCRARSVYLTTRLLGRLSPLSG